MDSASPRPPSSRISQASGVPCPACGAVGALPLVSVAQVPVVCNALTHTRGEALAAPRGDIDLAFCRTCGLVYNAAFDSKLMHYDGVYENALHFSPQFREYAEQLAQDLVSTFALRARRIVELGCGDGSFLSRLCEIGGNEGFGFDPAFDPARSAIKPGIRASVKRELYTSGTKLPPPDFVSCRHVLEHIARPHEFLSDLNRALHAKPGAGIFFEVPDCRYMLEKQAIWDIIYEHCNYFTDVAMARLFESVGFEVIGTRSVYAGQFLTIRARVPESPRPGGSTRSPDPSLIALAQRFAKEHTAKATKWRGVIHDLASRGRRAVLWGAGSKGVTFLNTFSSELSKPGSPLQHAVDLNPRKHGCYIVGAGQEIVAPERVRELAPEVVIIMNPIYRDEIGATLRQMGVKAEVLEA